jgi:hypothetical protein
MNVPRIVSARALIDSVLRVEFEGGDTRDYDLGPLLSRDPFTLLREPAFFRSFVVELHGHAVVWNDDIDIAAYELFRGGQPVALSGGAARVMLDGVPTGFTDGSRQGDPVKELSSPG